MQNQDNGKHTSRCLSNIRLLISCTESMVVFTFAPSLLRDRHRALDSTHPNVYYPITLGHQDIIISYQKAQQRISKGTSESLHC